MSTTNQHDLHLDAEQFSAFAEHALNEAERRQVLAHLAVCGRCREVIALAHQALAADEMVIDEAAELEEAAMPAAAVALAMAAPAPAAANRPSRRPIPWWRSWRLVWVPAAALAATAGFAIYIHLARVQHDAELAKNTPPPLSQNETAQKPAPQEQAKELPAPPAPAEPHTARKMPSGSAGAAGALPMGLAAPAVAPLPAAAESIQVEADQAVVRTAEAEKSAELRGAAGSPAVYKAAAAAPPTQPQMQADLKKQAADRGRQAEKGEAPDHLDRLSAASLTPAPGASSANSESAVESNAPAAARSDAQESRDKSVAAFGGAFRGTQAYGSFVRDRIHLPSGLDAASLATADRLIVAIDTAGAVFLSEDGGGAWKLVAPQWTGRAVSVHTHAISAGSAAAAPQAKPSTQAAGAAPGTPSVATVFELVTDKNQVWLSADGVAWTAK